MKLPGLQHPGRYRHQDALRCNQIPGQVEPDGVAAPIDHFDRRIQAQLQLILCKEAADEGSKPAAHRPITLEGSVLGSISHRHAIQIDAVVIGEERGDYARLDFSEYDAVFAYLSPAAMPALWDKASREMRPGSLLASYEFPIPGHPPTRTANVNTHAPHLYIWDF